MGSHNITGKDNPAGSTFLGVAFDPEGIPAGILRSLASMLGISYTQTKLCPFCEETIKSDSCTCRYCNRVLMKEINFRTAKNNGRKFVS